MAERRMFAKTIVLSDEFLDMPTSTRYLYFTLGMFADDDGFVNNPKSIIRQIGASVDDMNILIGKKFVIAFEDGVIVIKHWRIHNYIQSDRKKDTKYLADKETLFLDENKAYTQNKEHAKYLLDGTEIENVSKMDTKCIQTVSIGKDSIGKDSISKDNKDDNKDFDGEVFADDLKYFLDKWHIQIDDYNGNLSEFDFEKLDKAYSNSVWLQNNFTVTSKICKHYEKIITGKYNDEVKTELKPKPEEKKCEYNFDSLYAEGPK